MPNQFGEKVSSRFPKAAVDIEEAAKCLAFDRATASAFHLMRALEVGLQALCSDLGIAKPQRNWQNLLNEVDKAVRGLPRGTEADKEYLAKRAGAAAHLRNVKDAWRNDTMHPRATYTVEQASDLWNHTKAFMASLAEFL